MSKEILYTYRGDGCNGCVIGGTALVDNTVRLKAYPNRIVAATDSTIVKWNTDHLANVMHEDKEIESAVWIERWSSRGFRSSPRIIAS